MKSPVTRFGFAVLILLILPAAVVLAQTQPVRRLGLFIGCNQGDQTRPTLLYATSDAENMAEVMNEVGGIDRDDTILLLNPHQREINNAFRDISSRIGMYREITGRIEVIFYYSGHSDDEGLLIGREKIRYPELRSMLKGMGADVTIAIIDSCSSGAITRLKGGKRVSPFMIDDSSKMEGHAYLTSSSATEASQESDIIKGSFFTYFLMAGLRGAADNSGDGRITLNELYQHTYQETLYRTERTLGGPQHPSYEIQLTGTGDLVMSDITRPDSSIVLGPDIGGRLFVRSDRGILVAELDKIPGTPLVLALQEGTYVITVKSLDSQTLQTRLSIRSGDRKSISLRDLSVSGVEVTRLRGDETDVEDDVDKSKNTTGILEVNGETDTSEGGDRVVFAFSFWKGTTFPRSAETQPVIMTLGLLAESGAVAGGQIGLIGNNTPGSVRGVQLSNIYNIAGGDVVGGQLTSIFNMARSDFRGIQASGLINVISGNLVGGQVTGIGNSAFNINGIQASGIYNIADNVNGAQISGIFNIGAAVSGAQISGLFNYSESSTGVLIAPVNISGDMRAFPIGLVNISRNGILSPAIWYDSNNNITISFRSGSETFYTILAVGCSAEDFMDADNDLQSGFLMIGLGGRLKPTRIFYIDQHLAAKFLVEETGSFTDRKEYRATVIPTYQLIAGFEFKKHFAIEGGVSLDVRTPLHNNWSFEDSTLGYYWGGQNEYDQVWGIYPSFFAGLRF